MATSIIWMQHITYDGVAYKPLDVATVDDKIVGNLVDSGQARRASDPPPPPTYPDPLPQYVTEAELRAFTGIVKRAGAGATTTGNVILIGDYAYAVGGIATSVVFGGALGYENVIGGNTANVNTATSNLTGAMPSLAGVNGNWNFLLGGYDNVVNGWACTVMGYHCKVAADANHVTISGGSLHDVLGTTQYGTIGGGTQHQIGGNNPTVGGGNNNKSLGNGSTIGGGQNNTAAGNVGTVGGGTTNVASGAQSTVAGGMSGTASGASATVGGGQGNAARSSGATVPGGRDNVASGPYAIATGRAAVATDAHQHAHGSAPFAVAGDAQISRWPIKRLTTDATPGDLEVDTATPPAIPENTTWAFNALLVARRADADGENAAFEIRGCFKRDAGNTAALVGTPTITSLGASAGAAAWTVAVGSQSAGVLRFTVTGEAGKTIRWLAELRAASVSG